MSVARGVVLIALTFAPSCVGGFFLSGAPTTILWQITVDNDRGFEYQKLRVFVHFQGAAGSKRSVLGFLTPDEQGRFSTVVPAGSKVSVEVTTSDPTVRWKSNGTPVVGFYSMERHQDEVILGSEHLDVPVDSPPSLSRVIELRRAAAVVLCLPLDLKKGAIEFRRVSEPEEEVQLVVFWNPARIRGESPGGARSGHVGNVLP